MSEIRETTTIDDVEVALSEPVITLGELLAGVGYLAYQGTKFVVKGAVIGGVLAYKGGRALANELREPGRNRLSLSEISPLVDSSASVPEALASLANARGFEIPKCDAEKWKARIGSLVATDSKLGVAAMAKELTYARQERLKMSVLKLTKKACEEIGFITAPNVADHGILVAKSTDGRRTITVAVDKAKEGDVKLHFDADGFHGGTCIEALDALQNKLAAKGVRFTLDSRRRKDGQPAFDGRRLPQGVHIRSI